MTFIINNKRSQVSQTKHTSKYQQKLNTSFLDRYHQSSSKSVSIIFTTYICRFHFLEIDYCCYFFVSKEWIIYYDLLILPTFEYMDYEGLKRILKEIKNSKQATHNRSLHHRLRLERAFSGIHLQGSNHQREGDIEDQVIEVKTLEQDGSRPIYKTNFQKFDEEGGEVEARLFQKLDEELNKVNAFYKDQVEAAQHEVTLLSKQMEALVALRVKVKSPDTGKYKIQTVVL